MLNFAEISISGIEIDLSIPVDMPEIILPTVPPVTPQWIPVTDVWETKGRVDAQSIDGHTIMAKMRKWPTFKPGEFVGQTSVLVGGGPSLAEFDQLRGLRRLEKDGAKIFAMNRTQDFLVSKGIIPFASVVLDPTPVVANYIKPRDDVRVYVGSQCHPSTFDAYSKIKNHFIYDAIAHDAQYDSMTAAEKSLALPKYGSTVMLRSIWLNMIMGFSKTYLFGVDSCYASPGEKSLHAYDKPETIHNRCTMKIPFPDCERIYETNGAMMTQAQIFEQMMRMIHRDMNLSRLPRVEYLVSGDGIIPDIASHTGFHADNKRNYQYGRTQH